MKYKALLLAIVLMGWGIASPATGAGAPTLFGFSDEKNVAFGRTFEARQTPGPWGDEGAARKAPGPSEAAEVYGVLYEPGRPDRKRGWITYIADEQGVEGTISINDPYQVYQIETSPERGIWLVEKDVRRAPSTAGCGVLTQDSAAGTSPLSGIFDAARARPPRPDTKVVAVRVLAFYTPKAGQVYGKDDLQRKLASQLIAANQVYAESKVYLKFQLAALLEWTGYEEQGVSLTDAVNFAVAVESPGLQGVLKKYKADLVSLLVTETGEFRARGYQLEFPGQFPRGIPSLFGYNDLELRVVAHEFGHNLGADHEPGNTDGRQNQWPYAFGHQEPGRFSSLMAYWNHCDPYCLPWLPWFSNPDLEYQGQPLGIANERDNHRAVNNNRRNIAAIR